MLRRALMFACALVLVSQPAWAREYFVAPGGSDTAAGTQQAPWRSVARVNSATLVPGDIVRFAGGGVWNAMLAPRASGTAGAPVVFSTYGSGRAVLDGTGASGYAGVAVTGRSSLVFEHLTLRGWKAGNQAVYLAGAVAVRFDDVSIEDSAEGFHQSPSAPSTGVTISHSHVAQIDGGAGSGVGINVTSGSAGWHVSDTVIEHVADSCVIDQGADSLYERVTAVDCGFGGLTYGTHGFYLKGPRQTLRDSSVRHAFTNCISVRFQDATIVGNTVSDCPIGIAWFEDATAPGTVTIVRNRVSDAGTGIYVDSSPTQSFSISQNTIIGGRRSGAKTDAIVSKRREPRRDHEQRRRRRASQAARRRRHPAGAYVERGNALYAPGAVYAWNDSYASTAVAFAGLRGQASADLTVDPKVTSTRPSAPDFRLSTTSPVRDAGVRDPAGLALSPGCDGASAHYCGAAPEPGAIELPSTTARPRSSPIPVAPVVPAPAGVTASVRGTTAILAWKQPAGSAVSFVIAAASVRTQVVATTRAVVTGLGLGRRYTFRLQAVDQTGRRSAAVAVHVRTAAQLTAAGIRPKVVARTRHALVVRIPGVVTRGTLRIAGRVLHVRHGLVRIKALGSGRRYRLRLAVPVPGQRPVTATVSARTR